MVEDTVREYQVSIARACRIIGIHRSLFYYTTKKNDTEVEEAIRRESKFGDGFWKIFQRIRDAGYQWNHKRVYRVYKSIHFERRSRLKKRLPARVKQPLVTPESPNITWSIDFVSDMLQCNRKFRVLNVIDDFNREAIAQEVSMSMPANRVISFLEKAIWLKGRPSNIRCDNGPEFISNAFRQWCEANDINIKYTQPGSPTQNGYIERFNGSYRRGVLDVYIFRTIDQVKQITNNWMKNYNTMRPHDALNGLSPINYRKSFENSELSLNL